MRTSGSVDHSRRARLTGAASRGSIWKTAGVSTAATYTNSPPTRTRRMSMAPVCSCDVSAVLYACVRQAFENSLSADMLAGRQELLSGADEGDGQGGAGQRDRAKADGHALSRRGKSGSASPVGEADDLHRDERLSLAEPQTGKKDTES